MRQIRSHADILLDLDSLSTAARDNAATLPSTEPHRLALEQTLGDIKAIKSHQTATRAGKQKATQDLEDLIRRGKELAIRLRGAIKADLGPRNEQLVNYGIIPIRKRPRKTAQTAQATAKPPATKPSPTGGSTTITPSPTPAPKPGA